MDSSSDLLKELRIERSNGKPARKRRWPLWLAVAVIAVSLLVVFGAGRRVEVETAVTRSAAEAANASVLDASGFVTARRIATVSSKITGKVSEVLIEEGQWVKAGQVLAVLEPVDADAQLQLAQAQEVAARSQARTLRAQLIEARASAARYESLWAQKLVARAQLDQATAQRDTLIAQVEAADRATDVANRQVAIAHYGLDNTVIRAPFSGVIVAKAAQPGEMISPISAGGGSIRTGIGTLVDMDSLEVQVDVNEAYIGRVLPKMAVEAVLNAYPEWKIPAEVIAIVPTADRSKATVKVRIAFKSKDPRIVPDMGVRVSFLDPPKAGAAPPIGALVPERAVVREGEQAAVFVVEGDRVRRIGVTPGAKRDADVLVSQGLKGGETVVLSPPAGLRDGSRISVKKS